MANPLNNKQKTSVSPFTCMHKVLHNFGDWEIETRHMTRIEKSIYFDMRTLYLKTGKSFSDDIAMLYRHFSCWSDEEKSALDFILQDKFKHDKKTKSYRHREWDLMIKNYRFRHKLGLLDFDNVTDDVTFDFDNVTDDVTNNNVTKSDLQRKAKSRQELKQITDDLTMINIDLTNVRGAKALRALHEKYTSQIATAKSNVTECHNDNLLSQKNVTKNHAITINQEPITNNQENNNTTTAGDFKIFDIQTWNAPSYENALSLFSENKIHTILSEETYIAEVDKFKAYNANQVAQGKPSLADSGYRKSKFIDWFKILADKQTTQVDDDLPAIYHQPTNQGYHPSHSKPAQKINAAQSVIFNGVSKLLLPNMTQQETYDYVMARRDAGESSDETYDRIAGELFGGVA